jgi:hypothetical protein
MGEDNSTSLTSKKRVMDKDTGASAAVYGLGFVGAAIYFVQQATTLWEGILGVLKAIIWPAMLVYKLLEFFKV